MTRPTRRMVLLTITLVLACVLYMVVVDVDNVNVRTWVLDVHASVPEFTDSELAVPGLQDRPSFGIAFSGGGTRSASATLGQLRALNELGWLDRARHVSSNSGGSWAVLPYIYLPLAIDEQRFLGDYIRPENLNDSNLHPSTSDPLALGTAIHNANTIDEFLELGRGDEAYSDVVASIFLEPFGLHNNEKYFTFHRRALDHAVAANPTLGKHDFVIVERDERPYLVVTGVMIGQQMSRDPEEYYPIEMTPLYTGIRGRFELDKDNQTVVIGGGYVESFGYDSYEPRRRKRDGRWPVRLTGLVQRGDNPVGDRYRFTLSDVLGATSAAPLATLSRNLVPNLIFPEFRHWSVDRDEYDQAPERVRRIADEFQHGDGADMDNLALTPLLARKTENIIVFINSEEVFQKPAAGCGDMSEAYLTDDVISYFRKSGVLIHNVVFADDENGLANICAAFAARQDAGEPLVYCQAYNILENERHMISPYRTSICWVHLDRTGRWIDQLDPTAGELVRELHNGEGSFENFPHYLTFAEQGGSLIDLNRERVIALSNLAAWTVFESAEYIEESLALQRD